MTVVNPYLIFNGNCDEVFEFYKSVFGGEFTGKMRFKDMASEEMPIPEHEHDKIMHVALPIGNTILMGSDSMESSGAVKDGNNFSVAITPDSKEEADRIFNGLSDGGKQTMPMDDAPWGAYFGMLTDKFGINWMVNYNYPR